MDIDENICGDKNLMDIDENICGDKNDICGSSRQRYNTTLQSMPGPTIHNLN